jgi:hypothetical protein
VLVAAQIRNLVWEDRWDGSNPDCLQLGDSEQALPSSGLLFSGPPSPTPNWNVPESELETLMVERWSVADGLQVFVSLDDKQVGSKLYTREFLESGEIDRLEFATPLGNRVQVAHGGVPECDSNADLFVE